ncbi:hypothetical protein A6R68_14698, partial [Neotoma lepida]
MACEYHDQSATCERQDSMHAVIYQCSEDIHAVASWAQQPGLRGCSPEIRFIKLALIDDGKNDPQEARAKTIHIKNYLVIFVNININAIRGLNYLHQNGCIHRSFKASHILISGDGLVTLSGLSHLHSLVKHGQRHRAVFDFPQFSTSVQPWLSPELLRQDLHGYNVKSDIYSVGITACELASGQVPFQDMHRTQMLLQKLKGPPYSPLDISIFSQSDSRMRNSQSGVDSRIGENVLVSTGTHTVNSDRLHTPSPKKRSLLLF